LLILTKEFYYRVVVYYCHTWQCLWLNVRLVIQINGQGYGSINNMSVTGRMNYIHYDHSVVLVTQMEGTWLLYSHNLDNNVAV